MSRQAVRTLFVVVIAGLLVQYVLVGVVGYYYSEPWPAVVMPGFKDVWDGEAAVTVTGPRFEVAFRNGARASVPVERLLAEMPRSHHNPFLRAQCQPASLSGSARTERCRHPGAARWAAERLRTLFPGQEARHLDVVWNRIAYVPGPGAKARATPLDTLSIPLR